MSNTDIKALGSIVWTVAEVPRDQLFNGVSARDTATLQANTLIQVKNFSSKLLSANV